MYRFTDYDYTLELEGVDLTGAQVIWCTFAQFGREVFTKDQSEATIEGQVIQIHLTQENTGLLSAKYPVFIQLRLLLSDGKAYTSEILKRSVEDVLKPGVMTYESETNTE